MGRIRQVLLVLALQVLVLDYIHLWGYATPLLGVLLVVYTPLDENRTVSMSISFLAGVVMDMFANTPGVGAAAMTLASFIQHPLLVMMLPKDSDEGIVPSLHTMGTPSYFAYMAIMLGVYHAAYFALEVFSFVRITDLLVSMCSSYALSLVLAMSFESLRFMKKC